MSQHRFLAAAARVTLAIGAFSLGAGFAFSVPSCGSSAVSNDAAGGGGGADAGEVPEPKVTTLHPDAPPLPGESECVVVLTEEIVISKAKHVDICSEVSYATNPPSGGNHWPVWAAYAAYDIPVPREMYVHNLEHGAVALLHRCKGDCPDVLAAFDEARAAVSGDEKCLVLPGGPTERVVTSPDPLIDAPIAVAAWGATYVATCIDTKSLVAFVKKHYDHGTESTCAQGKLVGDPDGGAPVCADGGMGGSGGTAATGTGGNFGGGGAGPDGG